MVRLLTTSTGTPISSGAALGLGYEELSHAAVVRGLPYTVDVRLWDAESDAIIERLTHDCDAHWIRKRS